MEYTQKSKGEQNMLNKENNKKFANFTQEENEMNSTTTNATVNTTMEETKMDSTNNTVTKNKLDALARKIANYLLANIDEQNHVANYDGARYLLEHLTHYFMNYPIECSNPYEKGLMQYFEPIKNYLLDNGYTYDDNDLAFFHYQSLQECNFDVASLYYFVVTSYHGTLMLCPDFYRLLATMMVAYPWTEKNIDTLNHVCFYYEMFYQYPDECREPIEVAYVEANRE